MKNHLLLFLICLFVIGNVNAQTIASQVETDIQLRAGELPFGYCGETIETGVGVGATATLSGAIRIPASITGLYAGRRITKIRIGIDDNATNVSVWIRNSLNGTNLVSQTVGNASKGWTEVTLSSPYTLTANDIYVGYTATGNYFVGFSGSDSYDGCWLYYDNAWDNLADYGWGSLCIQALIDPQGATILGAEVESIGRAPVIAPNTSFTVNSFIKNYSSVAVTSVKISSQLNSQPPVEQTFSTSIESMKTGKVEIPISAIAQTGIYQLSLKVLEVNGQSNALANNTKNAEIKVIAQSFPRKVIMEEGTGTWCGWCPRGTVGMALMKSKYPDTFIGIAVHNGDPMTVTAYDNYMGKFFSGYPEAVVNRTTELVVDPYYGSEQAYLSEIAQSPIAGVKLTGAFTDANRTAIALKTVTTFGFSANNANYRLAYVLLENGVTGYAQVNYYAGGGNGEMGGYESRPSSITNMVYDDVARGIYSEPTGISGSIPTVVTEMTPLEHNYTITLPSSIKDKSKLEAVVMLINANTEVIENADKIVVSGIVDNLPFAKSDVISVTIHDGQLVVHADDPVQRIDVYNITGQMVISQKTDVNRIPVTHLNKGVYIVKVVSSQGEQTFKVIK